MFFVIWIGHRRPEDKMRKIQVIYLRVLSSKFVRHSSVIQYERRRNQQ